jgi:tetratricopeptide (TPR) repeat protein
MFSSFAWGQRGFNYYKDPNKVGSTNNKAFSYFKKAYYNHIWTWSKSGADSAEYYLKLAIEEDSTYGAAYAFLGHVYQFKTYGLVGLSKNFALQKKYAEKAISLHPKTGDAYSLLSDVRWHERDTVAALSLLHKAIEMEPDHVGNYIWLAVRFSQLPTGKDSAIYYLHKLIALDPEYGQAYMKLANLYFTSNQLDSASWYYRKTIQHYNQVKPRDNRMMAGYFGLANVLLKEKKYDSAFCYYHTYYRELAPTNFITKEIMLKMTFTGMHKSYQAMIQHNQSTFVGFSGRQRQNDHSTAFLIPGILPGVSIPFCYASWTTTPIALSYRFINYTYTSLAITQLLHTGATGNPFQSTILYN